MRISEAILKGCELTGPNEGTFFEWTLEDGYPVKVDTCAIGAAVVGMIGLPARGENVEAWNLAFIRMTHEVEDQLGAHGFVCPVAGCEYHDGGTLNSLNGTLAGLVEFDLNDYHGWPRETIAQFLAELGY